MASPAVIQSPSIPLGFRAMTALEAEALQYGAPVAVLDTHNGSVYHGRMWSASDCAIIVQLWSSKAEIALDLDEPDMWSDEDEASGRDRKPPTSDDGQFVAVVSLEVDRG